MRAGTCEKQVPPKAKLCIAGPVDLDQTVTPQSDYSASFCVMSFNLRCSTAEDGLNAWPLRRDAAVAAIRAGAPDLLCTQEVMPDQHRFLDTQLEDYWHVPFISRCGGRRGEALGIHGRRSAFELLEDGLFWLSQTPQEPGSIGWGARLPRICRWALVRSFGPARREPILLVNVHFDHHSACARAASADLVDRWMRERPEKHQILAGDFNEPAGGPVHVRLAKGRVDALSQRSDRALCGSYHGFGAHRSPAPIDWIIASASFRIKTAAIDQSQYLGRWPSDHHPVTAVIAPVERTGGREMA